MKRNKKSAAVDTAAGRLQVAYWPDTEKLGQAAEAVRDKVDPYRQQVADRVGPLAQQARKSGAHYAHNALEKVTPALDEALERVTPAVEGARTKVQDDLLPKLSELLAEAADHPAAKEASKRGKATAAALRGELEVPKKRGKFGKIVAGVAIIAAIGGAAAYALRKFLDNRDAEWEAPAPSAYGTSSAKRSEGSPWASASDSTKTTAGSATSSAPGAAAATAPESSLTPKSSVTPESSVTTAPTQATVSAPEAKSTSSAAQPTADKPTSEQATDTDRRSYGAGSYVGTKPPAGFTIKGNERSMKYHTSDSPAYERTISDVWFNSEQAAEANGFSKAQR